MLFMHHSLMHQQGCAASLYSRFRGVASGLASLTKPELAADGDISVHFWVLWCMRGTPGAVQHTHERFDTSLARVNTFSSSCVCSLAGLTLALLFLPLPSTVNSPGHSFAIASALSPVIGCTTEHTHLVMPAVVGYQKRFGHLHNSKIYISHDRPKHAQLHVTVQRKLPTAPLHSLHADMMATKCPGEERHGRVGEVTWCRSQCAGKTEDTCEAVK